MTQKKYIDRSYLLACMFITYIQQNEEFKNFLEIYADEDTDTLLAIADTWEKENEAGTFRQNCPETE